LQFPKVSKDKSLSAVDIDTPIADNSTAQIDPVAGKSVAEIFGEIVWLMTQDKDARELSIKDLERLVMPGILLRQFHIQYAPVLGARGVLPESANAQDDVSRPSLIPISVEIFAMCSEVVAAAIDLNPRANLTMQDWRSGAIKKRMFDIGSIRP
jgi:RTX toxin acyltransferase family